MYCVLFVSIYGTLSEQISIQSELFQHYMYKPHSTDINHILQTKNERHSSCQRNVTAPSYMNYALIFCHM